MLKQAGLPTTNSAPEGGGITATVAKAQVFKKHFFHPYSICKNHS